MSAHTPGPWRLQQNAWDCISVYAPNGQTIAKLEPWELFHEEHVDERAVYDANLIRAAPDLLEALEALVHIGDRKTAEWDKAHDAIRKAKGTL